MTWKLYDALIEQVPSDIKIERIYMGETWTIVHAGPYCGIAVTVNEQNASLPSFNHLIGADLQSAAALQILEFFRGQRGNCRFERLLQQPFHWTDRPRYELYKKRVYRLCGGC